MNSSFFFTNQAAQQKELTILQEVLDQKFYIGGFKELYNLSSNERKIELKTKYSEQLLAYLKSDKCSHDSAVFIKYVLDLPKLAGQTMIGTREILADAAPKKPKSTALIVAEFLMIVTILPYIIYALIKCCSAEKTQCLTVRSHLSK